MNKLTDTQIRREFLRLLMLANENREVKIDELTKELRNLLRNHNITNFTEETVRKELLILKRIGLFTNRDIRIPFVGKRSPKETYKKDGVVLLSSRNFTSIEFQEAKHAGTKYRLGEALWHSILGIGDASSGVWSDKKFLPKTHRQISSLRKRSNLSIFLDSGSTTKSAARALLAAPAFPITVSVEEIDSAHGISHLLRPCIVTNCVAIADDVARSAHRASLLVRLIGGDLLPDYGSIAGSLSDLCLQSWDLHADIAVIGSTGIRTVNGVTSFGCSDRYEARLKSTMLENALLKVVIFDSTKLVGGEAPQIFASVKADVDIIVCDNGSSTESKDRFERLVDEAAESGVSVLEVVTDTDESSHWPWLPTYIENQPKDEADEQAEKSKKKR